jgi:two-component system response regulator YesN
MNILLVDDNCYVLEGMKDGIDFVKLGFDGVYTALNSTQAKEIIDAQDIAVVLADIEMPGESGLQLLEWINDHDKDIVTVFCTSYANFNYAQEAVRLHSFDYYLKPIRYEKLSEIVAHSAEQAKVRRSQKDIESYGKLWQKNKVRNTTDFWRKVLFPIRKMTGQEIESELTARHLNYSAMDQFCLCIVKVVKSEQQWQQLESSMQEFIIRNITEEISHEKTFSLEVVFTSSRNAFAAVFRQIQKTETEYCESIFAVLQKKLEEFMGVSSSFYYYMNVSLEDATEDIFQLEEIYNEDISSETVLVEYHQYQKKTVRNDLADFDYFYRLLEVRDKDELSRKIHWSLRQYRESKEVNRQTLVAFQENFLQIIYSFLKNNRVEACRLLVDDQYEELVRCASNSIDNLEKYMLYLVNISLQAIEDISRRASNTLKVIQYIDENYCRDINMNDLTANVYVNNSQLAQIFKNETGKSIYSYLVDKRVDEAKRMLLMTDMNVSEVSSAVSYDNFSYFTRLFKNKTGYTPSEYRKLKH